MNRIRYIVSAIIYFLFFSILTAQTPTDAITMQKGDLCLLAAYEHGQWDHYWEGERLRVNGNVGNFSRNAFHFGFAMGIIDRLNVIAELPYVSTSSDGGQLAGASGLQDISIAVKGVIVEKPLGKGVFYTLGTAGFTTRMTNYLSDYQPYSLGLGTDQFSLRAILQYKFDNGLYFRGMGAHIWRTETTAERDYYYNQGSFYTDRMDVPNAWHYQAVGGAWLLANALKIEAQYTGSACTSGDDIRTWNAGQPTNKAIAHSIGGSAQYYVNAIPGLSFLAYYSNVLDGRNTGKMTTIGGGITYILSVYSNQKSSGQ